MAFAKQLVSVADFFKAMLNLNWLRSLCLDMMVVLPETVILSSFMPVLKTMVAFSSALSEEKLMVWS